MRKLIIVGLLGFLYLTIVGLFSCVTQKTATKYFNKHDEVASGYCASKYPVKVGEPKVSEQDWSDTSDYCPTCLTAIASIPDLGNSDGSSIVNMPTRIINHYHVERDSIPYIDSALAHNLRLQRIKDMQTIAALQNAIISNNKAANAKYDALQKKYDDKSKKANMWMWIAIAAGAAFLGFRKILGIFFNK